METTQSVSSASIRYDGFYEFASSKGNKTLKSVENIDFSYKNRDGDTLNIKTKQISTVSYTKGGTFNGATIRILTPEEGEKLRKSLKDELVSYKEEIIKSFIEANGGTWNDINETVSDTEVEELEAKMPEYWSAENTAQRIVDFATSFFSNYKGDPSEFVQKIRSAIEDGFGQALSELGELPGPVGKLINKTHKLVFEKLDQFEKAIATQDYNS